MKILKDYFIVILAFGITLYIAFKDNWALWSKVLIVAVAIIGGIVIFRDYNKSK